MRYIYPASISNLSFFVKINGLFNEPKLPLFQQSPPVDFGKNIDQIYREYLTQDKIDAEERPGHQGADGKIMRDGRRSKGPE